MNPRFRSICTAAAVATALAAGATNAGQPVALTAQAPKPSATAPAGADGPVAGFGSRIPMASVIPSIVPSGTTVSVEPGIDQGQLVSWHGGDSWHHALETALSPLDLVVTYEGAKVNIAQIKLPEMALAPSPIELPPAERIHSFHVEPDGRDLRDAAQEWGHQCDIEPVFVGDYNYPVEAKLKFTGTCWDAMKYLVRGFSTAQPAPILHQFADEQNYAVQIILGDH